jgi:hypothetical protein
MGDLTPATNERAPFRQLGARGSARHVAGSARAVARGDRALEDPRSGPADGVEVLEDELDDDRPLEKITIDVVETKKKSSK